MDGLNNSRPHEQDWHNDPLATLQPSLMQNGTVINNADFDWFLSQLPTETEDIDERQEWVDIGRTDTLMSMQANHKMERRHSQSNTSVWGGSARSASGSKSRGIKRRRVQRALPRIDTSTLESVSYQARQRALQDICTNGWNGGCLAEIEGFICEDKHCFAMEPMGEDPRGYAGEILNIGAFEVRIIEPPITSQRLHLADYPAQSLPIARQMGKSLHLIIVKCPKMTQPRFLESGFALLIVCQKAGDSEKWSPFCITSFTGSKQSAKTSSEAAHFVANLDRCTKAENGKRIWGERTSHVKHERCPAKPLRLEPRGPGPTFANGQEYCIVVTLHDTQGRLLLDTDSNACIAESNPFFFTNQEKRSELPSNSRQFLDQFEKLSVSHKSLLITSASSSYARSVLLSNSHDTQRSAGVFISTRDDKLPASACPLADFYQDSTSPHPPAYLTRLQAVASYLGHTHANVDLTDQNIRFLRTLNAEGAEGRYGKLITNGGLSQNQDWLHSNGISMKIVDCYNRVQILQSIMLTREYRSNWIICVTNVYPPEVMVDQDDDTKVHCLIDRAGQEILDLANRLYPLARLAFCSKIPRSLIEPNLLKPYIKGFKDAGGNGLNEEALHEEKFWLILQGIFLDYFLYWTELRGAESCKRIEQRLLEDDYLLDKKFFGEGKMHKFRLDGPKMA